MTLWRQRVGWLSTHIWWHLWRQIISCQSKRIWRHLWWQVVSCQSQHIWQHLWWQIVNCQSKYIFFIGKQILSMGTITVLWCFIGRGIDKLCAEVPEFVGTCSVMMIYVSSSNKIIRKQYLAAFKVAFI